MVNFGMIVMVVVMKSDILQLLILLSCLNLHEAHYEKQKRKKPKLNGCYGLAFLQISRKESIFNISVC